MFDIFQGCPGVKCCLDDIIILGTNEQDHLKNLQRVPQRISDAGLKRYEKCVFGVHELSFVGHTVSVNGVSPLLSNVEVILEATAPSDRQSLSSFLGMMGYYSKFIKNYLDEVEPLRELL